MKWKRIWLLYIFCQSSVNTVASFVVVPHTTTTRLFSSSATTKTTKASSLCLSATTKTSTRTTTTKKRIKSQKANNYESNSYAAHEEHDRRQSGWLVRTTSKFLGDNAIPIGSLKENDIRHAVTAMSFWSQRAEKPNSKAHFVVEKLLKRLQDEYDAGNTKVRITTNLYNLLLSSWVRSSSSSLAAERAQEILNNMQKMYDEGNVNVRPNRISFNHVMKAWTKQINNHNDNDNFEAYQNVEALIDRMKQLAKTDKKYLPPGRRSYNFLLFAYTTSRLPDAGSRAKALLNYMIEASSSPEENPDGKDLYDINSFSLAIKAQGLSQESNFEQHAQDIFQQIQNVGLEPNTEACNFVMNCWRKSATRKKKKKEATKRIQEMLDFMDKSFIERGKINKIRPNAATMHMVLLSYSSSLSPDISPDQAPIEMERVMNEMKEKYNVKVDTTCFNILLDAWAKSGRSDAPTRAMEILDTLEQEARNNKEGQGCQPDAISYGTTITCLANSDMENAGEKASELLSRMLDSNKKYKGAAPTVEVFHALFNAWATRRSEAGGNMAWNILEAMEYQYKRQSSSSSPKPDLRCYNAVLKAQGNGVNEHVHRAQDLLKRMIDENDPERLPDTYSYSAIIYAIAFSTIPEKPSTAFYYLNQMMERYREGKLGNHQKPNNHVFNAFLNACAFLGENEDASQAFGLVEQAYKWIEEFGKADVSTYAMMLRACANLSSFDERKDIWITQLYKTARSEGLGDDSRIMNQLHFAASPYLYETLTGKQKTIA